MKSEFPIGVDTGHGTIYLPEDSDITWGQNQSKITVRYTEEFKEIRISSVFGRLLVLPQASNSILVTTRK